MCEIKNCRGCEYEKARGVKNEVLNWLGVVYIVILLSVAILASY